MLAGMYVKTYLRAKFWRTSKTIESLQRKTKAWASNFSENKTPFTGVYLYISQNF